MNRKKGTLGKPIYHHRDYVSFFYEGQILEGIIGITDAYGTMEQAEEPSYDIVVGGEDFILFKHIRKSDIIRKVWNDESQKEIERVSQLVDINSEKSR